jgi:predicted HTH transcriptional regulator
MKESDLLEMLGTGSTQESSLIERKPDNFKDREARKVVVAFANSTPEGQEAVLFIGLHDKTGDVIGVANPDELQRKYGRALAECYPSITYRMHTLAFDGKIVVAIVVPSSSRKPHFAGAAYVRNGSQSILASDELYQELILSRTDKTRELLKFKRTHTLFSVRGINYHLGSQKAFSGGGHTEQISDCYVVDCDAFGCVSFG